MKILLDFNDKQTRKDIVNAYIEKFLPHLEWDEMSWNKLSRKIDGQDFFCSVEVDFKKGGNNE